MNDVYSDGNNFTRCFGVTRCWQHRMCHAHRQMACWTRLVSLHLWRYTATYAVAVRYASFTYRRRSEWRIFLPHSTSLSAGRVDGIAATYGWDQAQSDNNTCRAAFYHLRALQHIRSSLTNEMAQTFACAVVHSRLDYCNSLYVRMSDTNFAKLQRVQNSLARIVTSTRKHDHTTPVFESTALAASATAGHV